MADAKPVEMNTTPTPSAPTKAGLWARQTWKRKLFLAVVGPAVLFFGGWYGLKHFTPTPPKLSAQSDPPPVAAPLKLEEPIKRSEAPPTKDLEFDLPPVTFSDKPATGKPAQQDFATLPSTPNPNREIKTPAKGTDDTLLVVPPPIARDVKDQSAADITLPPIPADLPSSGNNQNNKTGNAPLKFGPAPLPSDVTKETPEVRGPIIRVGGADADTVKPPMNPPKKDNPPIPNIDDIVPPVAPVPMGDRKDDSPAVVAPKDSNPKKDDLPTIVLPKDVTSPKPAKNEDLPPLPKIDLGPATPPVGPMPAAAPTKRDSFDEDWHTPRPGEGLDFAAISREYYKTADYAEALAAYKANKERRQSIIRVPPPWVLEEQFPHLIRKSDSPGVVEAKPTANVRFEPAAPATPAGRRPAPPPAGGTSGTPIPSGNDEYKVTAPAGETIREIAQKVLGNANAWRTVWDLNKDVDPTQPIPAGTTLRLPR